MFLRRGGMLTGAEIKKQIKKGNIIIDPYDPNRVNPNSYNLSLYPELKIYKRGQIEIPNQNTYTPVTSFYDVSTRSTQPAISGPLDALLDYPVLKSSLVCDKPLDMNKPCETETIEIPASGLVLMPGVLYLGRTVEKTSTNKFIPMLDGRSSGGRLGINVHICAGFGDIGFNGTWTLEISVVEPVRIYPYVEIAQVCYFVPAGDMKHNQLYNGKYNYQEDIQESKFYKDLDPEKRK